MAERTAGTNTTDRTRQEVETPDKPDSPTELSKPSWKYIVGKSVREFSKDQCTDLAAALTYYAVLALFPALLAMVSLLGLIGQPAPRSHWSASSTRSALDLSPGRIRGPLQELTQNPAAGLGVILGTGGCFVVGVGLCRCVRSRDEPRLRDRRGSTVLEAASVDDHHHSDRSHPGRPGRDRPGGVRPAGPGHRRRHRPRRHRRHRLEHRRSGRCWLALAALVVAILYYATPNVKQPKFRWISIGAVVAILIWVIASAAFGFYVSQFSTTTRPTARWPA